MCNYISLFDIIDILLHNVKTTDRGSVIISQIFLLGVFVESDWRCYKTQSIHSKGVSDFWGGDKDKLEIMKGNLESPEKQKRFLEISQEFKAMVLRIKAMDDEVTKLLEEKTDK